MNVIILGASAVIGAVIGWWLGGRHVTRRRSRIR